MLYVIDSAGFSGIDGAAEGLIPFAFRGSRYGLWSTPGEFGKTFFLGEFLWVIDFKGPTFLDFCGSD